MHAYPTKKGNIYITVRLFADKTAVIAVRDKGCGIADVRRAHAALEEIYIAAMDFDAVSAKTDAFLTALQKEW